MITLYQQNGDGEWETTVKGAQIGFQLVSAVADRLPVTYPYPSLCILTFSITPFVTAGRSNFLSLHPVSLVKSSVSIYDSPSSKAQLPPFQNHINN